MPQISTNEARSILEARQKAKLNLVAFRHIVLDNTQDEVEPAPFHYGWSDSILNGQGHEVWECYRESAKTQIILRSFPAYQLAFPEEMFDYMILIKNNATLASAKLKEITNEYMSNKVLSANHVRTIQQSSEVLHIETLNDQGKPIATRIEAFGKGASIRGSVYQDKRPKICIIDDPQDTEDAKSEVILESDWNWFLSDVHFLGQNTRIFLIGNNLGDKCIVERVMKNAKTLGFNSHRIPIEIEGVPTWPQKFDMSFITKEKESYRNIGKLDIWLRERMCQSTSEETRTFSLADFPRFSFTQANQIAAHAKVFATLDPAASTERSACFRSICVNAVTPENHWMIVDMLYGRWDSTVLIDKIFQCVSKWGMKLFGIEKGMLFQFMEPILRSEMVRRQIYFDLVPLDHGKIGSKLERIKMLAPRSKAHSIWLPDYAEQVDGLPSWITELELELTGITKDAIKSEYVDLLDSLAMMQQMATPPVGQQDNMRPGLPGYRNRPGLQRTYDNKPRL